MKRTISKYFTRNPSVHKDKLTACLIHKYIMSALRYLDINMVFVLDTAFTCGNGGAVSALRYF